MKKLSDYKDEAAIELWADLLEPMTSILGDKKVIKVLQSKKPPFLIAKEILSTHKEDAIAIMLRIDPEPIDGINIITRLVNLVLEFMNHPDLKNFFASAGQGVTDSESFGNATASTEDGEN